ncbi:hypothetical protein LTR15_010494 [Elasticomyces elasticus]|nr:hypothetical protein LTR15_010494 [Elasticomyces elasticus]
MPPKSIAPTASVDPTCNSCGTNTGLERIDATKINGLLDTITNRLSSDVYGNWFIEGAKGKDSRLGQLTEITSLKGELEAFKTSIDKYIALHAPKEVEKPATMNKGMRATVDKMVVEKLQKEIQGLRDEVKHLREAEAARKVVEDRSKINGKTVPTSGSYGPFPKAAKHDDCPANAAMNKLTKRLDTDVKDQAAQENQISQINGKVVGLGVAVAALELWKKRKDAQQSNIVNDVSDIRDRLIAAETEQKSLLKRINSVGDWACGTDARSIEREMLLADGLVAGDAGFGVEWRALVSKQVEEMQRGK